MKFTNKLKQSITVVVLLLLFIAQSYAQSEQQYVNIGDFTTTNGDAIKNTKIGYRTIGKLNSDKSNVVLWPTWFTGTSEQIIQFGVLNNTIDTEGLYIIIVDALGNGVSSSPSNTKDFPEISIRDMVNSQHKLLTNHLKIDHVKAVMGISMGGMQTYEWLVAYPEFMDKAIAIIGTPKQSFYDLLFWQTQIDLLENAGKNKRKLNFALKRATDIFTIGLLTPDFYVKTQKPEGYKDYMKQQYAKMIAPKDYLVQMKAMVNHNIYKSSNSSVVNIGHTIKADVFIVVNKQDHVVNPTNSITISKSLKSEILILDSESGHMAPFFNHKKIKKMTVPFLRKNTD